MSEVIFDITKPPIGTVTIALNDGRYNRIVGLDGVGSFGTHIPNILETLHRTVVSFVELDEEGIAIENLLGNINVGVGRDRPVRFQIGTTEVEGTLKHQPAEQ